MNLRILGIYSLLLLISGFLRFYHLGDIASPVFDEVYFPKFAYGYIQQEPFFHTHPPFAKYLMSLGMQIYYALPGVDASHFGTQSFESLNPISYRWVNALVGSFLCLVVARIVFLFSRSHLMSILAATLVLGDGSIIVDSRFGLSNIHIVFWGFTSLWMLLEGLYRQSWTYWILMGICIGLVASVKWNGLAYWVIACAVLTMLLLFEKLAPCSDVKEGVESSWRQGIRHLSGVKKWALLPLLTALPLVIYSVLWIPDLKLNTRYDFLETHQQMLSYHADLKDEHPYCSRWWSWPLMLRPISYHFEAFSKHDGEKELVFYKDVHSFGNPVLYWLGALSILVLTGYLLRDIYWLFTRQCLAEGLFFRAFIVGAYFVCWLPWAFVSRCTFFYHYQSAAVFSFIASAYVLYSLWQYSKPFKVVAFVFVLLIALAFVYWLPFQLGIELEKSAFYQRMWLSSWI